MKYRTLANTNIELSAIGLGCMGMTHAYGVRDDEESVKVLHRALDLGINFWDTADMYGNGSNEELVANVLSDNREKIIIATKFGFRYRSGSFSGMGSVYLDVSPRHMQTAVDASLRRLKIDTIDLYYAHRLDPKIPVEETVGAMAELVRQGKVRFLGLSEVSPEQLSRAATIHPIAALQNEYSLLTRDIEKEMLPLCRKLGIPLIAYSPLSRGLITNKLDAESLPENDFRKTLPRFASEYRSNNEQLAIAFEEYARSKNCTAAQLALAWVLSQGEDVIPIPGTKKLRYLEENARSVEINLTPDDKTAIQDLLKKFPDTGPRFYPTQTPSGEKVKK